ncbi:glycine cleavage system protein R [Vibrio hippocampi]|uniref:Glycine cleavage system transcriptional repressor n=1 Tax=Vibrio hippocampi TaxID=654686 RepID=A0ABM8ZHH8_9VIBR|nr:ACT domain-containing protein [Vibrio hippocampi]CAH0525727.1 hypothetical protein VHP8226_01257 [Vibrio hippocampi]
MSNCTFIANLVGQATPNTIRNLATVTHDNDGKWLVSKVNFVEEHVSAIIKVELPEENKQAVQDAFRAVESIVVQFTDTDAHKHNVDTIFKLRFDSNDRAGIVKEITHLLDGQDIHILDMDCQRVFVAGGGGVSSSLFTANMALKLPEALQIEDVANDLEALSDDTRVILTP